MININALSVLVTNEWELMALEDYLDQFTVTFGKATSVSRNIKSTVNGKIETVSAPVIFNGTSYGGGGGGGGAIKTSHETIEQGMIVAENGCDYPVSVVVDSPFLRENADCAVLLRRGKAVSVTNVATETVKWVNEGPASDRPKRRSEKSWLIVALALIIYSVFAEAGNLLFLLLGVAMGWRGVRNISANAKVSAEWSEKAKLRSKLVAEAIERHRNKAAVA